MAPSTGMGCFGHRRFFAAGFDRLGGLWLWLWRNRSFRLQIEIPSAVAATLNIVPGSQRRDNPDWNLEVTLKVLDCLLAGGTRRLCIVCTRGGKGVQSIRDETNGKNGSYGMDEFRRSTTVWRSGLDKLAVVFVSLHCNGLTCSQAARIFPTVPESAHPRTQHRWKFGRLLISATGSEVRELLRPRTGAIRSGCGFARCTAIVQSALKLRGFFNHGLHGFHG